jgi:RNA polymerase sigma-70 factor (ECF subfamily)
MNEQKIVEQIKKGNIQAFESVIDAYVRRLRTFVALNAPFSDMIDEIAHETFVYAFQNIHKFETGTSLFAWFRAIAKNLIRSEIQRRTRERSNKSKYVEQQLLTFSDSQNDNKTSQKMDYLDECLGRISNRMRRLLDMKYKNSLSRDEIAVALKQSPSWVGTTLFRIRNQLKDCIELKRIKERQI